MTVFDGSLGFSAESTYGTYVAPARTVEFNSESMVGKYDRAWSNGIRAGRTTWAENQFQPISMGAAGSVTLNPQTKGFGLLLSHMLGSSSIGSLISGHYLQTHTVGTLYGKSLTAQINRPYTTTSAGVFSYLGCKVSSWSMSGNGIGGLVEATLNLDARQEDTSQSLAAVAYPSAAEPFYGVSTTVTVDGSTFACNSWSISGDNGLALDRYKIGNTAGRKDEPLETQNKTFTGQLGGADFTSLTLYNKIASATSAGALASITITCLGVTDSAAALTITMPKCVLTGDMPTLNSSDLLLNQGLSFRAVQSTAGATPITITYNAVDVSI